MMGDIARRSCWNDGETYVRARLQVDVDRVFVCMLERAGVLRGTGAEIVPAARRVAILQSENHASLILLGRFDSIMVMAVEVTYHSNRRSP